MKTRRIALGLAFAACLAPAQAQQKMPLPVEDDPNAPQELHGHPAGQSTPTENPGAPAPPPEAAAPGSPYSQAIVRYKAGDYAQAWDAVKDVDPSTQDDNFVALEGRILAELKRYDDGEKLLRKRLEEEVHSANAQKGKTQIVIIALGDLLLHKRSYERAAKYYNAALEATPNDPDLKLKLIYARIGSNDLRSADQLASELSPFDPKNPYDDHASYYFARAALDQTLGRPQDAEEEIQSARTNYGVTVTNRYLKTYLQFFSAPDKNAPNDIVPTKPKP